MKKLYEKPTAQKLEFDYVENVVASRGKGKNPGKGHNCTGTTPGQGCGFPDEVTVNDAPGNCSEPLS